MDTNTKLAITIDSQTTINVTVEDRIDAEALAHALKPGFVCQLVTVENLTPAPAVKRPRKRKAKAPAPAKIDAAAAQLAENIRKYPDAPHGRKADGTPKAKPGRAAKKNGTTEQKPEAAGGTASA